MNTCDKIILNVIASFKMEHMDVPFDVIHYSKELLDIKLSAKSKKNKALIKRGNNYDKRGVKY